MVAGTLIGTLSPVVALGPNVLAVFGAPAGDKWDNVILGTMLTVVMLVISVIGIRLSARTQVSIGIIEYALLITIAVTGLWWVLTRHPGSFPVTRGWFSLTGIGGKGSLPAGFLLAVFMYSGWDGTLYVNEEVRHRRENPGKAAMTAVIIAPGLFVLAQVGLQGVVSPAKLQANSASALVYVATVIGGPALGKCAAVALACARHGHRSNGPSPAPARAPMPGGLRSRPPWAGACMNGRSNGTNRCWTPAGSSAPNDVRVRPGCRALAVTELAGNLRASS